MRKLNPTNILANALLRQAIRYLIDATEYLEGNRLDEQVKDRLVASHNLLTRAFPVLGMHAPAYEDLTRKTDPPTDQGVTN